MYVNPNKSFLRTTPFKVVFGIGLCLVIANIVLNSIYIANSTNCITYDYCTGYSYHYWECIQGGIVYCCDPSSSSSSGYYCGGYSDCYWEGTDYKTCAHYSAAQWILGVASIACLITLIVLQQQHKKRVITAAAGAAMQNQVIFSDDNGQNYQNYGNNGGNPGVVVV